MPRYALSVEIFGTGFSGTQVQPHARTVQRELHGALAAIDSPSGGITPCGRLDSGVHAAQWVVHCDCKREWRPTALGRAFNSALPADVAVTAAARVDDDWHARYAPHTKTYVYRLYLARVRPVLHARVWWQRRLASPGLLEACATHLVGEHDLSAFAAKRGDASDDADPVRRYDAAGWRSRTLRRAVCREFSITGTGFLYKQIRGLVGAMVGVARERCPLDDFIAAIDGGRGALSEPLGSFAPAQGLTLERVEYDDPPAWLPV